MIRTLFPLVLAGLVFVTGMGTADEDDKAKKDDSDAPRLKRKKRDDAKPKDDKPKDDKKEEKKDEEKIVPEDGPGDPEEDDKDVLERVSKNMRAVEEKLGNREVGDPTQQQQRDILRDIDSLIRRSQNQEQGGGGGGVDQQPQDGMDEKGQDKQSGAQKQKGGPGQGGEKMSGGKGGQGKQRVQRQPRQGRGQGKDRQMAKGQGQGEKQGMQPGGNGNQPGKGGDGQRSDVEPPDSKIYKDVWGHLPESLRAEMNAYSNPRPFMPRYDDLIKKYYRTIAEQGRKKE